ncbi:MAG: hypothetical protein AAF442_02580 [Pseudomonadota bacterium]
MSRTYGLIALLAFACLLSACTMTRALDNPVARQQLGSIEVARIDDYSGQMLRHNLERALRPRSPTRYTLIAGQSGHFSLREKSTGQVIYQGRVNAVTRTTQVGDAFVANAAQELETRRKLELTSHLIVTRLVAFFARQDDPASADGDSPSVTPAPPPAEAKPVFDR